MSQQNVKISNICCEKKMKVDHKGEGKKKKRKAEQKRGKKVLCIFSNKVIEGIKFQSWFRLLRKHGLINAFEMHF